MTIRTDNAPFYLAGDRLKTTKSDDGGLVIEGMAAVFSGIDRENENFAPSAFAAIEDALKRPSGLPLLYHHQRASVIGRVLDLKVTKAGLWMRAAVDPQRTTSPLRWIVDAIRRGTIKSLSVGGLFKRKLTEAGTKIVAADILEISATALPVHGSTSFAVVGGKAISFGPPDDLAELRYAADRIATRAAFVQIDHRLRRIQHSADIAMLRAELASL